MCWENYNKANFKVIERQSLTSRNDKKGILLLSSIMRKHVFGVFNQVWHKLGCTATEDGWRLGISDLWCREICYLCTLTRCAVQRIWIFDFAHAKIRFSHDAAQSTHIVQALRLMKMELHKSISRSKVMKLAYYGIMH